MPLGVGQAAVAQFGHGRAVANRREHVLQRHPLGQRGSARRPRPPAADGLRARAGRALRAAAVARAVVQLGEQVSAVAEDFAVSVEVGEITQTAGFGREAHRPGS